VAVSSHSHVKDTADKSSLLRYPTGGDFSFKMWMLVFGYASHSENVGISFGLQREQNKTSAGMDETTSELPMGFVSMNGLPYACWSRFLGVAMTQFLANDPANNRQTIGAPRARSPSSSILVQAFVSLTRCSPFDRQSISAQSERTPVRQSNTRSCRCVCT